MAKRLVVLMALLFGIHPVFAADFPEVVVYKSPTCGCCNTWVNHLRKNGFTVTTENADGEQMNAIKQERGIDWRISSCHTARVGGYTIEGHVPAADIRRLLRERPEVNGLAVPGMPVGSPGMEGPNPRTYSTYGFRSGSYSVFAEHLPGE